MVAHRFDPAKLDRLNDVGRLVDLNPEALWEAFGTPGATSVVEIGAGTGMFVREFALRMPAGTLYAVDSEPVMLDWMRDHPSVDSPAEIVVTDADAGSIPLPDGIADLVYTVNLHHELDDPARMLAEARRLLHRGGTVAIVDWKREATPKGPPIEHRVAVDEIARQLSAAGFESVRVHDVLAYHSVVTGVVAL
ncbi:MAG: class I SAM-dependent methyltransferase [Actinobacteria bacterium]|nr:MAG: class I SAM-dependent methyltransferase [Actinomycetota bacterium]